MDARGGALRIDLLGAFRVEADGRVVDPDAWRLRKSQHLVKLLALTPRHRLHREQLMDLLWPDLDPEAAANQLRKALHRARRALDPTGDTDGHLLRDGEQVVLVGEPLHIDAEAFTEALGRARSGTDPVAYRSAADLYGGELLPDDRYEEWTLPARERLRSEHVACLAELAGLLESRTELDAATATLRELVAADPTNEEAHTGLMRLHALAGRRPDALAQFDTLRDTLARELGVAPSPAAQRLHEEIRAGLDGPPELTGELWERVGDLRVISGDGEGAATAFRSALAAVGDAPGERDAARLHRKAAHAALMDHDTATAARLLATAETLLGRDGDGAERSRFLGVSASLHCERGELAEAQAAAQASLELAEAHGDEDDVAAAHDQLAIVAHYRGAWREGLHEAIARLARATGQGRQLLRVFDIHHCIGQYHLYGDRLSTDVEDYARTTLEMATRSGARPAEAFAWCLLGESLLLRGHWDEAAACLERSGTVHAELGDRTGALPWLRLAELSACRGDHDAVPPYLRRGAAIATVSPLARHMWGRLYATQAFEALEDGDPEAAVEAVRSAARAAVRHGDCPSCSAQLHPVAAEAYADLGDAEAARSHADAAGRFAEVSESSAWRAMAESAAAAAAQAAGDEATAHTRWAAAGELYERAEQPFWAARSRVRAAAVAPDAASGSALRAAGVARFRELGARRAARRADAVSIG